MVLLRAVTVFMKASSRFGLRHAKCQHARRCKRDGVNASAHKPRETDQGRRQRKSPQAGGNKVQKGVKASLKVGLFTSLEAPDVRFRDDPTPKDLHMPARRNLLTLR